MINQIERGLPHASQDAQNDQANNNKLPHGVAPETHGLLLYARDHKEILHRVDSLNKGKKIANPTRNLLAVYFGTETTLSALPKFVGGNRTTNTRRILQGLEIIWNHVPPEIQSQYPKEKAVRLKENQLNSPMEGKKHSDTTIAKIRDTTQKNWNIRHDIEPNDRLAKKTALVAEWQRLSQLFGHSPSSTEITRLKQEGNTKFSVTMYKQEFGQGSFKKAREILDRVTSIQNFATDLLQNPSKILSHSVLEKDVKAIHATIMSELSSILSTSSIEEVEERTKALNDKIPGIKGGLDTKINHFHLMIGRDEKSMWSYAVDQNLLPQILQGNMLTQQEIYLLRRYFENGIIGEKLTEQIFNTFTIAVAKIS